MLREPWRPKNLTAKLLASEHCWAVCRWREDASVADAPSERLSCVVTLNQQACHAWARLPTIGSRPWLLPACPHFVAFLPKLPHDEALPLLCFCAVSAYHRGLYTQRFLRSIVIPCPKDDPIPVIPTRHDRHVCKKCWQPPGSPVDENVKN